MSTNYFAFGPFTGGESDGEGLHIGQTAAGWQFLWRAHPEQGLTSVLDWRPLLEQQATSIRSEYGVELTPDELIEIGTRRAIDGRPLRLRDPFPDRQRPGYHVDADGHEFCALDFF